MTLNAFYVMHYLAQAQGKPLTVNEISAYIGLSQCATSRMLHRFEASCQVIEKHKALPIGVHYKSNSQTTVTHYYKKYIVPLHTYLPHTHKYHLHTKSK
ncbi:MarR family transcriptional regulator [Galliscardovia ingluviei]|uniref:MarR family transcriptional regulator n=1 Tax=Galliscardovia ingluviei TaxID=1769422 RepID=UPI003530E1D4